jgi:hypothetical protein
MVAGSATELTDQLSGTVALACTKRIGRSPPLNNRTFSVALSPGVTG